MEIMIKGSLPPVEAQSGAEYLRGRKAEHDAMLSAAERFRSSLDGLIAGWQRRETGNGVRCYALTERAAMEAFLQRARNVQLTPPYVARITGPWPATEFLNET